MTKTLVKRKSCIKSTKSKRTPRAIKTGMGIDTYDPKEALLDEERIGRAILECLKNGDSEGVVEVIQIHLKAYNKT